MPGNIKTSKRYPSNCVFLSRYQTRLGTVLTEKRQLISADNTRCRKDHQVATVIDLQESEPEPTQPATSQAGPAPETAHSIADSQWETLLSKCELDEDTFERSPAEDQLN